MAITGRFQSLRGDLGVDGGATERGGGRKRDRERGGEKWREKKGEGERGRQSERFWDIGEGETSREVESER